MKRSSLVLTSAFLFVPATLAFANDTVVKIEIADEQRWAQARQQLLSERRSFYSTGPSTPAGAILSSANEGPLQ